MMMWMTPIRISTFLLTALCGIAVAQEPPKPKLDLRGDRFRGLTYEELTPEQKVPVDRALAGRGPIGTFNILLRSPQLMEAMRGLVGGRSLSAKQNELVILLNARYWTTQYEWMVHHRAAVRAGLSDATIAAITEGRRPAGLLGDEEPIYNFMVELLTAKQVSDASFQSAKDKLGEKGIVDMLGVAGFYGATSMFMNVDRYPMDSPDQKPELKVLDHPLPSRGGTEEILRAQAPPAPKTAGVLRGDRFKPLTSEEMATEQKNLFEMVTSGKIQGGTGGPLNVLLRSPQLGESVLRYGAYERFQSPLPAKLVEMAALITTRAWTSQFPWQAHHRAATQAGLSDTIITAIANGRRPAGMQADEEAVYNFGTELFRTTQMSDGTFAALKDKLGERGVVEVLGVMGYYQIVSMTLNVDRYPVPDGAKPELGLLANPIP
jgi:4-carboxymuconolactone decarboxylase